MNFEEFNTAPCILPQNSATSCGNLNPDPRCADPEFGADNPDICPGAAAISGLMVVPDSASVEVGEHIGYRAYLTFADGKGKDVTLVSSWVCADNSVASVNSVGLATGQGIGATTVIATYRGYSASADLDVVAGCSQAEMDIVLVFDRSAGMGQTFPLFKDKLSFDKSILKLCQEGSRSLVSNARLPTADRIAVVSCAGSYTQGLDIYAHAAELRLGLSGVQDDILSAIDNIPVGGCAGNTPVSLCATGLGAGLQLAYDELTSVRARPGSRKVIVLVSLGYEVFGVPDPVAVTATIKAAHIVLVGLVPYPSTDYVSHSGAHLNNWTYIQALVSCDFFLGATSPNGITALFAKALGNVCEKQNDACMYYIPWPGNPTPPAQYRDQLDYFGWNNWLVTAGFVDLIGIDLYPLQPGHGLFMDLVGTDQAHDPADKNAVGTIQSKQLFTLAPGHYRLSFDLAGNLRQDRGDMAVRVSVGPALNQLVSVTDWQQQFTPYSFDFTVSTSTSAAIRFEHQPLPAGYLPTVGLLLDNVKLENLDTAEVLLNDSFDTEHPI